MFHVNSFVLFLLFLFPVYRKKSLSLCSRFTIGKMLSEKIHDLPMLQHVIKKYWYDIFNCDVRVYIGCFECYTNTFQIQIHGEKNAELNFSLEEFSVEFNRACNVSKCQSNFYSFQRVSKCNITTYSLRGVKVLKLSIFYSS